MQKEFICINCPLGCRLSVTIDGNKVVLVEGNVCNRGVAYAEQEALNPLRTVTALMRASNRDKPFSVKTVGPVPKHLIFKCINEIYDTTPQAPIVCGDVVIEDICHTGVAVAATQDIL